MVQMRRWGKEYVDRRNWKEYNESLVRRGEVLLDFDVMDEWKGALKNMNAEKRGRPFHYPEAYVRLLAYLHVLFHPSALQAGGGVRQIPLQIRRWIEST